MGIVVKSGDELVVTRGFDLIIDGIIGYNLSEILKGCPKYDRMIR